MIRDISNIKRDLEDKKNNDIFFKKAKLKEFFEAYPDLNEILGKKDKRPLNKFADKEHPTAQELEERNLILEYNKRIDKKQIIPMLKLNGINKEVLNFIMYDINDDNVSYVNESIKNQIVEVMCLVHEDDVDTEYGIMRTDLLSYIVKDLLCWTNALGKQLKCIADYGDIVDTRYYCRTLKFKIECPNNIYAGRNNKYDKFRV